MTVREEAHPIAEGTRQAIANLGGSSPVEAFRYPALRALHVVPSYYPAFVYGGPIFSIHYLCQALARAGVEVHVATTNANGSTRLDVPTRDPVLFEPNYDVHYYNDTIIGRFSWRFTAGVWRDIRLADIIHLQDVYSLHAAETLFLAKLMGKPVVVSPRGVFSGWALSSKRPCLKKAWNTMMVRPFAGNPSRVVWHATSDPERAEILAQFPRARVHVVLNAIDCSAYHSTPPLQLRDYIARFSPDARGGTTPSCIMVGMGRLHAKKAFGVAIKAFAAIVEAHPTAVLLIAGGDDGERSNLERLIAELDLQRRIALVGEVRGDDKIAFLKGADLFLFPSHSENFGMVCLEALAAGVPVVASRNTPWAEVEAERAGRWVDNTPEAFAAAIKDLLSRDLRGMRENAQILAARYDLAEVAEEFKRIYAEMIDAGSH